MKKIFFVIMVLIFFFGCTQKNLDLSDVDRELSMQDETIIYDMQIDDISQKDRRLDSLFLDFPFISQSLKKDFKGHFSLEFYKKHKLSLNAKRVDRVNYSDLEKNFNSIDIIYTKKIWVNQYKQHSNELFVNLCDSYRLSYRQQNILKQWIKNGGIFWIENGLYGIGDDFDILPKKTKDLKFLDFNVSEYIFDTSKEIVFDDIQRVKQLENIKSLKMKVTDKKQINFIIDGSVLISSDTKKLLCLNRYGKGKILSMLPFEFTDLNKDGELLRWKLLDIVKKDVMVDGLKIVAKETVVPKKRVKEKKQQIKEGLCIQLFSTYSYKDALKDIEDSKDYKLSRIENRGKIFTARVGMYSHMRDLKNDFKELKKLYPNAFVRRCIYRESVD